MSCERKAQTIETLDNAILHDAVLVLLGRDTLSRSNGTVEVSKSVAVGGGRYRLSVALAEYDE